MSIHFGRNTTGAADILNMVWVTVRMHPDDAENPTDILVSAVKKDDGRWVSPPEPAEGIKSLLLKRFSKKTLRDFINEEQVRLNISKAVLEREVPQGEAGEGRGDTGSRDEGTNVLEVVLCFAKAFGKKISESSKSEKNKAKPPSFSGNKDKITPETWIAQFE